MTLAQLDQAFNDIWLHPDQLLPLLEKWQELVAASLVEASATREFIADFDACFKRWEHTLQKNRDLLQHQQADLKALLKQGELKHSPAEIKKKFS